MHALIFAAVLAAAPQNSGQATRAIVMGVCLPFVAEGAASADNLALAGLEAGPQGNGRNFQTADGRHLVELSTGGHVEAGNLRRACVVQDRAGDFRQVRRAVEGPLEQAGFRPVPDEPENRAVWSRSGGQTVSVHQNRGRAAIIRVSYSMLEAEAP